MVTSKMSATDISLEPPAIKQAKNEFDEHETINDLSTFQLDEVLYNNSAKKTVCLKGTFRDLPGVGIVLLEKTAFEEDKLNESGILSKSSILKKIFQNDIYGNYHCSPAVEFNQIKTTVIHPATSKHIEKYSTHPGHIIDETPEIYEKITLPHITSEQLNLKWVYNILEHTSEKERIIFEDPDEKNGFILLPDLKWDGIAQETLYVLGIVRTRNLKSLRDLKGEHLELLRNIRSNGCKAIKDKYGLDESRLRIYFHYQPSFYHLHVHFTYLHYEAPGIYAERSHLLSNVISNLELLPDYYEKVSLPFVIYENNSLFKKFESKGYLKRI